MPLLLLATALALWLSLQRRPDWMPFVFALLLFLLSMIGLGISIWPDVVPGRVSIWQAAAPHTSQLFLLVGALILIPIILGYTAFAYWVFRGKVGEESYH
jgi:cytochrome d ubiquinol oxidase subunit II